MKKKHTVYIETYGCSASYSDSEICAGQLTQAGYSIVDNPRESDVNIIVTCTVKTATAKAVVVMEAKTVRANLLALIAVAITSN